jgi:hypothetical protein
VSLSQDFHGALHDVVANADDDSINELRRAFDAFEKERGFSAIRRQSPFARDMLDAIREALELHS